MRLPSLRTLLGSFLVSVVVCSCTPNYVADRANASLKRPAAGTADAGRLLQAPITVSRLAPVATVPVDVRAEKLYITASVNGSSSEFIFDTGSPTVLTKSFAEKLGLQVLGYSTGLDANGTPVTMGVTVLDSLSIGDVVFRGVPVLVHDYSSLPLGNCLLEGGVIGSEVLPGSAWRIDLEKETIRIAASSAMLNNGTIRISAKLHDFGYPHAPILDYGLGVLSDKALFDTGSAEELSLVAPLTRDPAVISHVVPGSTRFGRGSEGESAGGGGTTRDLVRMELSGVMIGKEHLPPLRTTMRSVPPTLIGAGVLKSYIVTLDYPAGAFLLEPRKSSQESKPHAGYAISPTKDHVSVVQLFEGSEASKAGLRLGDRIAEINGRSIPSDRRHDQCTFAKWLTNEFDETAENSVMVLRGGVRKKIVVPATSRE